MLQFVNAQIVFPERIASGLTVTVSEGRIVSVGPDGEGERIDLAGSYLAPGFIDLHVHGGAGADFMDGTAAAFDQVRRCHARHGTTSLAATSTAADDVYILRFLAQCRAARSRRVDGSRVLGAHFYGPYFAANARGVHPLSPIRPPEPFEFQHYLEFADVFCTATIAPELPGANSLQEPVLPAAFD